MIQTITYTEPELSHYDYNLKKAWFVYFDITNTLTGETIRKQVRQGINYWKTKEDRIREGNALKKYWKKKLEQGWHPFEKTTTAVADLNNIKFNAALDFALDQCTVSKATKRAYKSIVKYIKAASEKLGTKHLPITSVKRQHIKLLLQDVKKNCKWSNSAYNKNIGYLSAVIGQLEEWEIIEYNPASKIKALPVTETEKFIPYTKEEKEKIRECLFLHHYRFFVYFLIEYHTGIRPKEILALKIKDVDLSMQLIKILPDLEEENSKTKKIRLVPINNELLPFLRELKLEEGNPNMYVFGSPYESGKGNKGSGKGKLFGAMHPDYFKPSYTRIKRDTVTRFWKKIIIDGLGINKYLYAGKHTGADDKILAGIELDALKELYGHSSKYMTEKYAKKVKQVYREKIIEQSPAF
jgi:integrase